MAGRRYLTEAEARSALTRGASVEQFLGLADVNGRRAVRWLTVSGGRSYVVRLHEVEDVGDDDFLDVSEFPPLDPDEYLGDGRTVADESEPDAAFAVAAKLGASADRWVNSGVVQNEYADSRRT